MRYLPVSVLKIPRLSNKVGLHKTYYFNIIQERFEQYSIFLASETLGTQWKMNFNVLSPCYM